MTAAGKLVRVKVKTGNTMYEGNLLIPPMRKRVSDILNEEERTFINLTDVSINGSKETLAFVALNKELIESIFE